MFGQEPADPHQLLHFRNPTLPTLVYFGAVTSHSLFHRALAPTALAWLAIHLGLIHASGLPLTTDELQYWLWSESLAWGYYSKPPGIAYAMAQWRRIDPQGEALRVLPQILLLAACALVVPLAREAGLDARRAWLAALLMACTPFLGFAQWFATTDALLLLFWNLSLLAAWLAFQRGGVHYWAMLGLAGTLGVLSKHFMPFFLLGLLAFAVWEKGRDPAVWRGLAVAALVAGLLLAPHLHWLFSHPDETLAHLAELQSARGNAHTALGSAWMRGVEFALAQCIGIGPLLIPLALIPVALEMRGGAGPERAPGSAPPGPIDRWLLLQSLPVLALFIGQAAWKQAYANWALPAAFTLGVWLVIVLMRRKAWRSLCAWLLTNLLVAAFIGHGASLLNRVLAAPLAPLAALAPPAALAPDSRSGSTRQASVAWLDKIDPFRRQRGWDIWVEQLRALEKPPRIAWAVRDRDSAARIRHAFPGSSLVYLSEPGAPARHHYAIHFAPGTEDADAAPCAWVVERSTMAANTVARPPEGWVADLTRPRLGGVAETWTVREVACATR